MNGPKALFFRVFSGRKWQSIETFRNLYTFPILSSRNFATYTKNKNADTSLFLTTLPAKKREKWSKFKIKKMPYGPLIVSCKNSSLNHFKGLVYETFEGVPLASKGWHHRKSKGDYFTIIPAFEHPAFTSSVAGDLPKTFEELKISKEIIEELGKIGVYNPTVIQAKAIQKLLNGENLMIAAETGCGKTLAYVIPMMEHILQWRKKLQWEANSPFGVVLVPSKELAVQVGNVITKLGNGLGLHCVTLVSGDFDNILKAPDIEVTDVIVTTLGIMMRYMKQDIYSMERCKHLVLDEADIFFDKEFLPDLQKFLSVSKLKLLGLCNATLWANCAQLCLTCATSEKKKSNFEEEISVTDLDISSTGYLHKVMLHVRQHFLRINKSQKPETLLKIIRSNVKNHIPTMVFCNRTNTCNFVQKFLNENGVESVEVHGYMFSDDRLQGFMNFKEGKVLVLVCTDCMARGLDMPWLKQIINYDFPNNMPSYIHRCGRVGRLGYDENCLVTNFVSAKNEVRFVNEIEKAARTGRELTLQFRKLEDEAQNRRRPKKKSKRRRFR